MFMPPLLFLQCLDEKDIKELASKEVKRPEDDMEEIRKNNKKTNEGE